MFIERDQRNAEMQAELFSKMYEIINAVDPISHKMESEIVNNVKFIDVEGAARELLAMGIKG